MVRDDPESNVETIKVTRFPSEVLQALQAEARRQGVSGSKVCSVRWAAVQFARSLNGQKKGG